MKLNYSLSPSLKTTSYLCVFLFCLGMQKVKAQYNTLATFGNFVNSVFQDGQYAQGNVTYYGKKLYGITKNGGTNTSGNIFCIDTNGNGYRDLYDFNGNYPFGSLIISGHKMYGMTTSGGANSNGMIFSIDTNGAGFKDMFDFTYATSGAAPYGSLILIHNKLYGMTESGGSATGGTVFSIDTNGNGFTLIHSFGATPADGAGPYGSLTLTNNKLYGMTSTGGINYDGVIFYFDTNGSGFNNLYTFYTPGYVNYGGVPHGDLTLIRNKFYGMTLTGGVWPNPNGVVFSIDTDGAAYDTLLTFNVTNGKLPHGSLTLMGDKLYGMTQNGGAYNGGLVFSVDTTMGTLGYQDVFDFNDSIGDAPEGSLTLANGILYGMTSQFGSDIAGTGQGFGTIFSIGAHAPLGIDNTKQISGNVTVYPNPNNGKFAVALSSQQNEKSIIEVYNILGEQVLTTSLNNTNSANSIDMSSQSNGFYLYKIITETGNIIGQGKLVIQK
jgi:uncharacterized repeat protein (TIGR03803 family)